ncbi:MAG: PEP-CTERM sorting domain-containing protein [Leptolyngbyaceae cyanobacterium CSU_1_4]|nr:PEP-CTERM sorting domain-containing protein [Leptolyngbyaceae cyanobacterium CSU_1_4]
MQFQILKTLLSAVAIAGTLAITGQQAQAGTMHNGWNYSIDSFNDGTEGNKIGKKSKFEFYGMAFKQTADKVIFAFNSNLAKTGYASAHAAGGNIGYGDLMLDFTGKGNLKTANGGLQAVHFAPNDMNRTVGLYDGVTAKSVSTANSGYYSTDYHTSRVNNVLKGKASYGDMASNTTYFNGKEAALNVINTGTYKGSVTEVSDFTSLGLDFGHFKAAGTHTFGFSIDKSLLPKGSFVASLFAECGNDGVVLTGKIPEPSTLIGLATVGLMVGGSQLRKRRQAASVAA